MPQSVLSRERVLSLLPAPLSETSLADLVFLSKAEIVSQEADALTLSVTPDRLDLLSEGGLALHLQGATDAVRGLPPLEIAAPGTPAPGFVIDPSVGTLRPHLSGLLVRAPTDAGLDAGLLAEAIRFQELLHATIGRDRRAASLGIYPFDRIVSPVRYALEPIGGVQFVPLDGEEEVDAGRFFEEHPMAARYGSLGRLGDRCLTLRDAAGSILSLPPLLNGRTVGEARTGDRQLLLEATGTDPRRVEEAVGLLLVVFAARGWTVTPMRTEGPDRAPEDGRRPVSPRTVLLPSTLIHRVLGHPLASGEVERRLATARLAPHPHHGGWEVAIPPWRPDLATGTDLAEEVALAVPLRPEDGNVPSSRTRGSRRAEAVFRRQLATVMLGLGFAAPHTPLLVSEATAALPQGFAPIRLSNPVSAEFAYLRDRILLSHLDVLRHNTRHGYPQQFAEVGPVVVRDPLSEAGGATRYHLGAMVASESAGFADAAAILDYLLRSVDIASVREPLDIPGTIPGRAARVRIAGEPIAELGELHPRILSEIGVPVPVAWAELDLTGLWPILGRRDTH